MLLGDKQIHVVNLKRLDVWPVYTISSLPMDAATCNTELVKQNNLTILEAIGKKPDGWGLLDTMDCHGSFTWWAGMSLKKRSLPDTHWAKQHMQHLQPILPHTDFSALVAKHETTQEWRIHLAPVDEPHLDRRLCWALRGRAKSQHVAMVPIML